MEFRSKKVLRPVLTARDTSDRLSEQTDLHLKPARRPERPGASLRIDSATTFQQIEGFGGGLTESAAIVLQAGGEDLRRQVLSDYFDAKRGLGYTFARTHMGSCDFSRGHYNYAQTPGDSKLVHFSIERDREALLPLIQDAFRVSGNNMRLVSTPWSPPDWMKTNQSMLRGGNLKTEFFPTYANYFVRYIEAYRAEGVPVWAVSVQNEPNVAQVWESCEWTPEMERVFIRDHLGPALNAAGLDEVKILIWDHNKDIILSRVTEVLEDAKVAEYVWGAAFHWYGGDHFESLSAVHDLFPDKSLVSTENCQEEGPHDGSWDVAERYGHEIIGDLNNWTVGFVDWNIVLNSTGGPNHVGNFCSAPILVDTQEKSLKYQPSFYYIGHFSKFVLPGAVRIALSHDVSGIEAVAFRNTDDSLVTVVMNPRNEGVTFDFKMNGLYSTVTMPARSIQTLILDEAGTEFDEMDLHSSQRKTQMAVK